MAGFVERVSILIDVTTKSAQTQLGQLKSKIDEAEGGFGKLKAAAGGVFTAVASSPAVLAAAGAAVVTFAAKSIQKFQDTAISAGKFADATGLSVENASRWIEVAGDVGIGADTIRQAFGKMEKAIASNRAAFGDLVVTAKDGTTDLNATFLNVISHLQGIKDPIERANEASKLFGRGFQGMAEILGTSADELKTRLAAVSDQQLITEGELAKARDFRASMDDLGDAAGDLQLALGQTLVPALAEFLAGATEGFIALGKAAGDARGGLQEILGPLDFLAASWGDLVGQFEANAHVIHDAFFGADEPIANVINGIDLVSSAIQGLNSGPAAQMGPIISASAYEALQATNAYKAALIELNAVTIEGVTGTFGLHLAQQQVVESFEAATEAGGDTSKTALEQQIAYDKAAQAAINLAQANAEQAAAAGGAEAGNQAFIDTLSFLSATASPQVKAALDGIIAKLKTTGEQNPEPTVGIDDQTGPPLRTINNGLGGIDNRHADATVGVHDEASRPIQHATALGDAFDGRVFQATVKTVGLNVNIPGGLLGHAAGGVAGGQSLVGEKGPELVDLPAGSYVHTATDTKRMLNGTINGGATYVTINLPVGTSPAEVTRQLNRYAARNGSR